MLGFAVSATDLRRLQIAQIWGLPVLEAEGIVEGRVELICQARDLLYKLFTTVEDLQEDWRLQPAPAGD